MQQQYVDIQPYIPFHVRLQLSQMDVYLDKSWHSTLVKIFQSHTPAVNNLIYEQILKPKGIEFDNKSKQFINTLPRQSLRSLLPTLTAPQTRYLAQQLIQTLDEIISKQTDIIAIAEYIESIIEQIEQIDTEDKPLVNQEKRLIKTHFLYDIELIVSNTQYTIPQTVRGLTEHQIKSFINDVYIKKQISEFGFNSIRSQTLKLENSPIMDYIIEERKVRLFEIFEGIEYYYLITPVNSKNEDPYSIRRFLYEEPSQTREFYYLNGIIIDKSIIQQSNRATEQQSNRATEQQSNSLK